MQSDREARVNQDVEKCVLEHILLMVAKEYPEFNVSEVKERLRKLLEDAKSDILGDPALSAMQRQRRLLEDAERWHRFGESSAESCRRTLDGYRGLMPKQDLAYWEKRLKSFAKEAGDNRIRAVERSILRSWRKDFEAHQKVVILSVIEKWRTELWRKISKWLSAMAELNVVGKEFGLLWDLSIGALTNEDMATVINLARFIKENDGVKRLCDMLGRIVRAEKRVEKELIWEASSYAVQVPDVNSKEEIIGLALGCKIEDALPSEIATFDDPDLAMLFGQKFAESRLLSFDTIGMSSTTITENREVQSKKETDGRRGPVIICVDTSASMAGIPEAVAKAIAMVLAMRARKEGRDCFMMTFSTSLETFDFSSRRGLGDLLSFLQMSFHGGTDITPAFVKGVELMHGQSYLKADMLVISDFMMPKLPQSTIADIEERRRAGNRFHALTIEPNGTSLGRMDCGVVFDNSWKFDPNMHNLTPFVRDLGRATFRS